MICSSCLQSTNIDLSYALIILFFLRMQIQLNGQPHTAEQGVTLATLIDGLELESQRFAIEVNEDIIPRSIYGEHILQEGDKVEIVVAIGGG